MNEDGMDIAKRSHEPLPRRDRSKAAGTECRLEQGMPDERRRFEDLVSDLSARFATLSLDEVDREIEHALKRVSEFFQGDRCGLLEVHPDLKFARITHAWYAEGIERIPGNIVIAESFPWTFKKLVMQRRHVSVARMAELPPEADKDRQSWQAMGVKSSLSIPLFTSNNPGHIIVMGSLRRELTWPEEYISRLRLLGEIFVNALERRNTDAALRVSEMRLSLAAESAETGLWTIETDTGRMWTTAKAKDLFGFAPDREKDFEGFLNVIHPEDRERMRRTVEETMRSDKDLRVEYRIVRPDRSIRWIISRGRPYFKSSAEPDRLMGVSIDITERKSMEENLRASEEKFRQFFKNTPDYCYIIFPDGTILNVNHSALQALGYEREQLIGKPQSMIYAPESIPKMKDLHAKWKECGQIINEEMVIITSHGEKRIVLLNVGAVRDKDGTIMYSTSVQTDITERKRAEEAFQKSEERILAVVENTSDMIWSVDTKTFGFLTFNSALRNYFFRGHGIEIRLGMPPEQMLPPDYAAQWHEFYARALREGAFVTEYVTSAKSHVLLLSVNLLKRGGEVFGISVFGKDITERKRTEQELRLSEDRFRQVAENVGDFIWEIDANGVYCYTSPAVERILGYTPDELIGKMHFYDLFAPDIREDLKAAAFNVFAAKESIRAFPNPNVSKDGKIVHLETSGAPMLDEAGNLVGYRGSDRDVTDRKHAEETLQKAYAEIKELKDQLQAENRYLQEEIKLVHKHEEFVGNSESIRDVLRQVEQVAGTDSTVLIQGETGTGKELLAHAVHNLSSRRGRLFVKVNCAALPPTLIESELFGREKGAFTGALTKQIGRFELADGSTLFLDEIDSLTQELQAKLLRVLQNGEFERLGSPKTITVNVRVIAATNRDLSRSVRAGGFREDLYYRLNIFPITLPPLRERKEDIPPLVWSFVQEFGKRMGKRIESIPQKSVEALQAYAWPGNVRELRNVVERAMILTTGSVLHVEMPKTTEAKTDQLGSLENTEKQHIINVLNATGWKVSGKNAAAEILGLNPKTLESKMKKLGIQRKQNSS